MAILNVSPASETDGFGARLSGPTKHQELMQRVNLLNRGSVVTALAQLEEQAALLKLLGTPLVQACTTPEMLKDKLIPSGAAANITQRRSPWQLAAKEQKYVELPLFPSLRQ